MSFHNTPLILQPADSIRDDTSSESGCPVCSLLYKFGYNNTSVRRVELEEAVQGGCPTCYIISQGVGRVLSSVGLDKELQILTIYSFEENESDAQVECCETEHSYPQIPRLALLGFASIKGNIQTPEPWNKPKVTDPLQDQLSPPSVEKRLVTAVGWLKSRLENCIASHSKCARKAQAQPATPGRLLDLETGLINPFIRLVNPGYGFNERYMTLSHRWGDVQPCKTTIQNMPQRYREITMEELPTTFQHAVIITQKLDVRFLWIDSLCIVQDDPSDWEVEASKMASIYSASFLTIAAVSSFNGNGGCIPEYPPSAFFKIDARDDENKSVYVRQDHCGQLAHYEMVGDQSQRDMPLVNPPMKVKK